METTLQNDQLINLHHVRGPPQPVDPAALVISHPHRRYVSLETQFVHKDEAIKHKVLQELGYLFHSDKEITYALASSTIVKQVMDYLADPTSNPANRQLAAAVIEQVASEKKGQDSLVGQDHVGGLVDLMGCDVLEIKRRMFVAIKHFSGVKSHRPLLLRHRVLLVLLDNLRPNSDTQVVFAACQTLANLLEESGIPVTCLSYAAPDSLMATAELYPAEVAWKALDCLTLMSQCSRSKSDMVAAKLHVRVAKFFQEHRFEPETVQRVFLILTNLGQLVDAKNFLVQEGFVNFALGFLNQYEPNPDLFLNTILFLTTLAEHPAARHELRQQVPRIQPFCSELFYPETWQFAQALLDEVLWEP